MSIEGPDLVLVESELKTIIEVSNRGTKIGHENCVVGFTRTFCIYIKKVSESLREDQ